jgi:hypothetical protein
MWMVIKIRWTWGISHKLLVFAFKEYKLILIGGFILWDQATFDAYYLLKSFQFKTFISNIKFSGRSIYERWIYVRFNAIKQKKSSRNNITFIRITIIKRHEIRASPIIISIWMPCWVDNNKRNWYKIAFIKFV